MANFISKTELLDSFIKTLIENLPVTINSKISIMYCDSAASVILVKNLGKYKLFLPVKVDIL